MKTLPFALLACAALQPAWLPMPVSVVAYAQDADDDFRNEFQKHLDGAQKAEQQKLVKAKSYEAAVWIDRLAEKLSVTPDPAEQKLFDALAEAWRANFAKSEFPARSQSYYAGLDDSKRRIRKDLTDRWKSAWREFDGNLQKKDGLVFANIMDEVEALAGAFESEGDLFHASEAYRVHAQMQDEMLRGQSADLHGAWKSYGYAITPREKLDLKDPVLEELKKRHAALAARGADQKGGGAPADPGGAAAPKAAGPSVPLSATMSFEMLSSFDAFQRPIYGLDDNYPMWEGIRLLKKDSVEPLPRNSDCPPLVRTGSSDIRFDTDGDGKGDEKLTLTGNIVPIKVKIGKGGAQRPWGFFATTGIQKDSYQGVEVNLAPDDAQFVLYTIGGASIVGTLGTTPVRLIDDTLDGKYGSMPQTWGTLGMTPNHYEPVMDTMVIGPGKRAKPYSELVEIEGRWYKLEVQEEGGKLAALPSDVDTGVLKLDFKGPVQPTYLVMMGSGDTKNCYFDIVEGGAKGVRVPVGSYTLYYGELRKGKKKQMQKAVIVPPNTGAPSWSVRKNEVTNVTLGAPFGFDFRFETDGSKLKVLGGTVAVVGNAGERYERPWNAVAKPEALWRKKGTKQAAGDEKMGVGSLDTINDAKLGWASVWFPLNTEIDAKQEATFEVQLVQKKHDLFGKVESAWKE